MSRTAQQFLDGCHQYGWLITIIINIVIGAFVVGMYAQKIDSLKEIITQDEQAMTQRMNAVDAKFDNLVNTLLSKKDSH